MDTSHPQLSSVFSGLQSNQNKCGNVAGDDGTFVLFDCNVKSPYVCQTARRDSKPDSHCPEGFFWQLGKCLKPMKGRNHNITQAQVQLMVVE